MVTWLIDTFIRESRNKTVELILSQSRFGWFYGSVSQNPTKKKRSFNGISDYKLPLITNENSLKEHPSLVFHY